jgi:serine protease AprX
MENNNMTRKILFLVLALSLFLGENTFAQGVARKYLVLLKDKNNSPYSVSKPTDFLSARSIDRRKKQNIPLITRDLPVNPSYISDIKKVGAKVTFTSKWMNAALVEGDTTVLKKVLALSFVKGIEGNVALNLGANGTRTSYKFETESANFDYGKADTQIKMLKANLMHDQGYRGEGMMIGVLDAGFLNADKIPCLKTLFDEKRVVGTFDFVANEKNVYEDDSHGTHVLSLMAASIDGQMVGTAPKASYLLLRSEDAPTEKLIEEANWLFAVEYADSVGVDLINSSLGYNEFDYTLTNHKYKDMNGNTTIAAKAADWAAATGIICVVSAGNEGLSSWRYISTPADADSIITVGSVSKSLFPAPSSSIGPSADGRVKPDLAALGEGATIGDTQGNISSGSGTSYSSPLLCGFVAGFWQANPKLTAMQVIDAMRKSGSQYTKPDFKLGYGIPDFVRVQKVLGITVPEVIVPLGNEPQENQTFLVLPNPFQGSTMPIFSVKNYDGKPVALTVTDILGKNIWTGSVNDEKQSLPFQNFKSGLYFLKAESSKGTEVIKIMKE